MGLRGAQMRRGFARVAVGELRHGLDSSERRLHHAGLTPCAKKSGTRADTIAWAPVVIRRSFPMMKSAIVGAAAILASALASPAMAQAVITNPGKCAQYYPNANCQNLGPGNPYTGSYQPRAYPYGDAYNSYDRWDGDRGYRKRYLAR
jgi:hypothetical protein